MLPSFRIAVKTHPVLVLAEETNGFGSSDELFYACVYQCGIGCIGSVLRFVYAEPEDDLNVSWNSSRSAQVLTSSRRNIVKMPDKSNSGPVNDLDKAVKTAVTVPSTPVLVMKCCIFGVKRNGTASEDVMMGVPAAVAVPLAIVPGV